MATAPNQREMEDAEYTAAFNEDQPGPVEQTEDEAFGMDMDESGTSDASTEGDVVTVEGDGKPAESEMDGGEMEQGEMGEGATTDTGETAEMAESMPAEEPMDPKELQRKKSWEGRLKAREEELRLREEALASGGKKAEMGAEVEGAEMGEGAGEAVAELAAAVDSGDMTPAQAMKTLEEDFGPEFVKMLTVLVSAKAGEAVDSKVGEVSKTMDQLIGEIVDDKARAHFELIADEHPDFAEINGSPALEAYLGSMPDEQRAKAEEIASNGTARQINKMLTEFKAWAATQGSGDKPEGDGGDMAMGDIDESAADAAEGVRSTGMALPGNPERDDSYESAWAKF